MKHFKIKAFTLIELLVVISIISLLSSIVLVSLTEVRERAVITRYVTEFTNLRNAIVQYEIENNALPFSSSDSGLTGYNSMIDRLVPDYLAERIDLADFYRVFGARVSQDPQINTAAFYCEGGSNPRKFSIVFRDNSQQNVRRFDGILPRWLNASTNAHNISGGYATYCLFTPLD